MITIIRERDGTKTLDGATSFANGYQGVMMVIEAREKTV